MLDLELVTSEGDLATKATKATKVRKRGFGVSDFCGRDICSSVAVPTLDHREHADTAAWLQLKTDENF